MKSLADLEKVVRDCILQHEGGEPFFDALDEGIRKNHQIIKDIYKLACEKLFDEEDCSIVVSGKFGNIFKEVVDNKKNHNIICIEGGLRFEILPDIQHASELLNNKKVVFIDDSFYSGKTRDKVVEAVVSNNGIYVGTVVVYDGSVINQPDVNYLFRYHP
jgi:hypothetical protein